MTKDTIDRRAFIRAAGLVALAAAGGISPRASRAEAERVPYSSGTAAPTLKAPANACDCHIHFYDDRFPAAPNATLRPPNSTVEDYRLLQKRLGISRAVIVTPSTYGTDNRPSLQAAAKLGSSARVVAVVDDTVTDAELKRLAGLGVRGIRFNLVQKGATSLEMVEPLAQRVHELGWHVQIHMLGDQIVEIADLLARLPAPIVFDHLGRLPQPAGVDHPAYRVILGLVDKGRAWVKVSGAYHDTKAGPPGYADTSAVGKAFVAAAPERMVWGSDWPHPTVKEISSKPDDAMLFDLLAGWATDERTLRKVLVDNPAVLYGFD
jgi:predicted TIM-barrel fold metal-dependent hydrolase